MEPPILRQQEASMRCAGSQAVVLDYNWKPFKRLCDIGGCLGSLLAQLMRQYPRAEGLLFDQPQVSEPPATTLEVRESAVSNSDLALTWRKLLNGVVLAPVQHLTQHVRLRALHVDIPDPGNIAATYAGLACSSSGLPVYLMLLWCRRSSRGRASSGAQNPTWRACAAASASPTGTFSAAVRHVALLPMHVLIFGAHEDIH